MNRRSFLGLLGSLPFLRWLKPKPEPPAAPFEYQYPLPDLTNPWPYGKPYGAEYLGVPFVADPSLPEGHYYMLAREHRAKGGKMLIEGMDDELWR